MYGATKRTLRAANNYAETLNIAERFEEAEAWLRKVMPVARRVFSESHEVTLRMRWNYAEALWRRNGATLHDLREAVATLEELERIARRVLGGSHPTTVTMENDLPKARELLRAREGSVKSLCEAIGAMTAGDT